jgi:hypothetical protein
MPLCANMSIIVRHEGRSQSSGLLLLDDAAASSAAIVRVESEPLCDSGGYLSNIRRGSSKRRGMEGN